MGHSRAEKAQSRERIIAAASQQIRSGKPMAPSRGRAWTRGPRSLRVSGRRTGWPRRRPTRADPRASAQQLQDHARPEDQQAQNQGNVRPSRSPENKPSPGSRFRGRRFVDVRSVTHSLCRHVPRYRRPTCHASDGSGPAIARKKTRLAARPLNMAMLVAIANPNMRGKAARIGAECEKKWPDSRPLGRVGAVTLSLPRPLLEAPLGDAGVQAEDCTKESSNRITSACQANQSEQMIPPGRSLF
jgi:hypothetical protein